MRRNRTRNRNRNRARTAHRIAVVLAVALAGIAALPGASVAVRRDAVTLIAAGDIASCDPLAAPGAPQASALATGAMIRNRLGRDPEALVAVLGDLAYPAGAAAEFQCFDAAWGSFRDRMRPAPGNHEYYTPGAAAYFAYFGNLAGPPGRGWYSYEHGSWHVIVLNSSDGCSPVPCRPGSPQYAWLQRDLRDHAGAACTLAYWHHPRFSSGYHGRPSSPGDGRDPLGFMQPFWALLAKNGVDVVLNGHDHDYERFAPMNAKGERDPRGMTSFVVGAGGATVTGDHQFASGWKARNSAVRKDGVWGVLTLSLAPGRYAWVFSTDPSSPAYADGGSRFSDRGAASCH
ncbi:MAG: metallophosphoesterase family protein [Chloroflexota bacterium]